jgi:hypothetical protein
MYSAGDDLEKTGGFAVRETWIGMIATCEMSLAIKLKFAIAGIDIPKQGNHPTRHEQRRFAMAWLRR